MIFVDRSRVKVPDILTGKLKLGVKETNKNILLAEKNEFAKMVFKAYSHPEVKDALTDLFKGKCAYCESKFLHVYPGDVEHFRPKGEIEEAKPKKAPGYYWLAADWNNLLLSCRNCNQKLKHQVFGASEKETMGKMNQFPLANGYKHIQSYKSYAKNKDAEEKNRLLINPCIDNPEMFFQYGDQGVIKTKAKTGMKALMANKSIQVYVLQRMPLVQAREKLLIEINAQIQRVKEATSNVSRAMGNPYLKNEIIVFDKILKREMTRLKQFTEDDAEFAGMARQVITEFLQKFKA